jgi:hypothetical protein
MRLSVKNKRNLPLHNGKYISEKPDQNNKGFGTTAHATLVSISARVK